MVVLLFTFSFSHLQLCCRSPLQHRFYDLSAVPKFTASHTSQDCSQVFNAREGYRQWSHSLKPLSLHLLPRRPGFRIGGPKSDAAPSRPRAATSCRTSARGTRARTPRGPSKSARRPRRHVGTTTCRCCTPILRESERRLHHRSEDRSHCQLSSTTPLKNPRGARAPFSQTFSC